LKGPRLALVLGVAALIGFGLGTWLGNATKVPPVAAAAASESAPPPISSSLTAPSSTPAADPTETAPTSRVPARAPEIILSMKGTKHEVTDTLEAKPGWQIQWQIDGDAIAVAVTGDPEPRHRA